MKVRLRTQTSNFSPKNYSVFSFLLPYFQDCESYSYAKVFPIISDYYALQSNFSTFLQQVFLSILLSVQYHRIVILLGLGSRDPGEFHEDPLCINNTTYLAILLCFP